jgi:hypothetical protein
VEGKSKNDRSSQFQPLHAVYGGKVKKVGNLHILCALAFMGAGMLLNGCKSAPELTQANAQALIQAEYDHRPAVNASITVFDLGMGQGLVARYWVKSKVYPNRIWADFTLTPEGKKALKLANGGDVIQWHPETANDPHYSVVVFTVAANHPKARDLKDVQDEVLPGVSTAKGVAFSEAVNFDGVPAPLQDIAHDPGNKLITKRQADFAFDGGAWKLHSIE